MPKLEKIDIKEKYYIIGKLDKNRTWNFWWWENIVEINVGYKTWKRSTVHTNWLLCYWANTDWPYFFGSWQDGAALLKILKGKCDVIKHDILHKRVLVHL